MEVKTIAEKLIKLSPSVRVVTVADMNGNVVFSAHKRSVKIKLSKSESKASLKAAAVAWRARRALSRKIGRCKYVVAEYEKVKRITMPAGRNHLLYVTTSPNMDSNKIIRRVRSMR